MGFTETVYKLTYEIIGAAIDVHKELGPGYPEKIYHEALMIALAERNILAEKEVTFIAEYHGQPVGEFRVDVLVDQAILVELKALDQLDSKCEQQIISYLTTTGREVGLLLNFGATSLEKHRYFAPKHVQNNPSYQRRLKAWKAAWLKRQNKSVSSVQSVEEA
jgi:GxxExxY protein